MRNRLAATGFAWRLAEVKCGVVQQSELVSDRCHVGVDASSSLIVGQVDLIDMDRYCTEHKL